jgi:outer membrane receptor protein involved in Fe transport
LQITPGSNNGQQTIIIRGIAPQLNSPTTATYIDDVPVGSTSGSGAGAELAVDLDPAELQRVEVLKGPQGTIYGSSSLGGVVKYVTRLPDLGEMQGRVSLDGSSAEHGGTGGEGRAALSLPLIQDQLAVSFSVHYRYDPGYLDDLGLEGKNANSGKSEGGRIALYYVPAPDWSMKLSASYAETDQDSDNAIPLDEVTRQPTYGRYVQLHGAPAGTHQSLSLYAATIAHTFGNGLTLTSATGYSELISRLFSDASTTFVQQALVEFAGLPSSYGVGGIVPYRTGQVTEELRLTSPDSGPLRWMAGFFYDHETDNPRSRYVAYDPNGMIDVLAPPFSVLVNENDDDGLRELAGFGNVTYYFRPNIWLTGGYRYSSIQQTSTNSSQGWFLDPTDPTAIENTHGSVGNTSSTYLGTLSWKPTDAVELYMRAASGYRPGGTQSTPPGAPADFNPNYGSDSIWNYELGLKGDWIDHHLSGTLAAYWIDWSNIQEQLVVNTFFFTGNGGRARSRGLEGSLMAEPLEGLTLSANISYTDAVFLESNAASGVVAGQIIPEVSKWTGGAFTEYTTHLSKEWRGFVGADFQFRSDNRTIDGFDQDAYQSVGLHVGVADGGLRIAAYVKNLTDQFRYLSAQASVGSVPFYSTMLTPRTVGISVSQKF